MINKIFAFLALVFFLALFVAPAEAKAQCLPIYECTNWSECHLGFSERLCSDVSCGKGEIREKRKCKFDSCLPNVVCKSWGECGYVQKTEQIIIGKLDLFGFQERVCEDKNKCFPSYIEEKACKESFPIKIRKTLRCENEFISFFNNENQEIGRIILDKFEEKKYSFVLVSGERDYCPSCFNAVKDGKETGIDCGGFCAPCGKKNNFFSIKNFFG